MLRVAILFEYPTLNGGEQSMLAAVDRVHRGQFEFVAIAPPTGRLADALSKRGIEQVQLALRDERGVKLPQAQLQQKLLTAIEEATPDMLHANSLSMGRLTGAIADELAIPTITHLRDILKLSRATVADLNRNRVLIAVSHATRDFHVAQGLSPERTRVHYNGVDCEMFQPRAATGRLKRDLGFGDDCTLTLTIGQIGLRKGQNVLADAAVLLRDTCPDLHFLLVGERNSAKQESIEFERAIVERFEQAGIGDRLHRLGYRDDVAWIMNEADLLVHPAHQEPLGRVLLEAAASGLPMIATNVGGTAEIVEDGQSARLIPPDNPASLATAVRELLDDPTIALQLAIAARQRIESTFDADHASQQLCDVWATCAF